MGKKVKEAKEYLRAKRATEELISAAENYLEAICAHNEAVMEVKAKYASACEAEE